MDTPADGYTLLLGAVLLHATCDTYKKLNYIRPPTSRSPRCCPDTITFGLAGVGSSVHMMCALFKLNA